LVSIGGSFFIGTPMDGGNPSLTSLAGLDNLTSIGGDLDIAENDMLDSFTGLEDLSSRIIKF